MSSVVATRRYLTNFEVHRLPHLFTDVVVIGAGIAGMRAALAAAESCDVLLITKAQLRESATQYAQGGISAVMGPPDSFEQHMQDTEAVACGLSHRSVVQQVVQAGPECIRQLATWGARFDQQGDNLDTGREGGHTANRVIHANGDATGAELVRTLAEQVRAHPRIRTFEHCFVIDVLTHDATAVGVVTHHLKYGHQLFWATATILASGGVGRVYRESTNPPIATGDGLAAALRCGAALRDMEMIQFHPTTLYVAGAARALISEAVRGEGAHLVHRDGTRFMPSYDDRGELASRDVVSRAILREMNAHALPNVYLDVRHLQHGRFAERFPTIDKLCRDFDIDPENDLIPVRPSAHYTVGGIAVDDDTQTTIPGLLACGEVACSGLHGANRLASNSLLEGLVFGRRAGDVAAARAAQRDRLTHPLSLSHLMPPSPRTPLDVPDVMHSLQSVMSRNVGIERSGDRLRETIEIIEFWSRYVMDKVFDAPDAWETQNLLSVALCVTYGAAARCESRGVHYRSDFPRRDDTNWRVHVDITRRDDRLQIATAPIGD